MVTMPRALAARDAELARLQRDNEMLRRENTALLTTPVGELQCRADELATENADLKAKLAALGVTSI